MPEMHISKINFKVNYKGKEYTEIISLDVRWNVVTFTDEKGNLISENYYNRNDIEVLVETPTGWLLLN